MRDTYLESLIAQIDLQIAVRKAKPDPGADRRKVQKPLPEGMEERRKLADRRTSRQGVRQKENEK